ncbi:MAG: hypothetical protein AAB425_07040, partial [Bdellovibrionota bacterium]
MSALVAKTNRSLQVSENFLGTAREAATDLARVRERFLRQNFAVLKHKPKGVENAASFLGATSEFISLEMTPAERDLAIDAFEKYLSALSHTPKASVRERMDAVKHFRFAFLPEYNVGHHIQDSFILQLRKQGDERQKARLDEIVRREFRNLVQTAQSPGEILTLLQKFDPKVIQRWNQSSQVAQGKYMLKVGAALGPSDLTELTDQLTQALKHDSFDAFTFVEWNQLLKGVANQDEPPRFDAEGIERLLRITVKKYEAELKVRFPSIVAPPTDELEAQLLVRHGRMFRTFAGINQRSALTHPLSERLPLIELKARLQRLAGRRAYLDAVAGWDYGGTIEGGERVPQNRPYHEANPLLSPDDLSPFLHDVENRSPFYAFVRENIGLFNQRLQNYTPDGYDGKNFLRNEILDSPDPILPRLRKWAHFDEAVWALPDVFEQAYRYQGRSFTDLVNRARYLDALTDSQEYTKAFSEDLGRILFDRHDESARHKTGTLLKIGGELQALAKAEGKTLSGFCDSIGLKKIKVPQR